MDNREASTEINVNEFSALNKSTTYLNGSSNNTFESMTNGSESELHETSNHGQQKHIGKIGMLESISIFVNTLTGPAMLNLPALFQRAGLIPTVFSLMFSCYLSSKCSLHMANVISKVPGNAHFKKEIEFSEAFRIFWGKKAFIFIQITFFCCITCLNIASIVDTVQVVDHILADFSQNGTIALKLGFSQEKLVEVIRWNSAMCSLEQVNESDCIPFNADKMDGSLLITGGYVLCGVLFVPMSLMHLKENALFQVLGFIILLVLSFQFIIAFIMNGIHLSYTSLWGYDWSDLFGVVLFNFALVVAVPAWLYEREKHVNVPEAINNSSLLSVFLYVMVGGLGALTMPNVSENMLQTMMSGSFGTTTEICSEMFAFFIIGLGIPLFSVLARLDLTGSGLCSELQANFFAVYLPWGVSWVFYAGGATAALLGWGGISFTSIVVFLAPLLLALHTALEYSNKGSISVYDGNFESTRSQIVLLYVLLFFSVASIVFAFLGEVYS